MKRTCTALLPVIVLHGGLFSRDDVTLADVRKIDRKRAPPVHSSWK